MKITCATFALFIQALQCSASDDSPFQLTNTATGFCLVKTNNECSDMRWTSGDRLLVPGRNKCVGVQGKSVGSEMSLYDCDETSELQKWECRNETVLALKDQDLYIELTADNTAVLSKTIGANNQLTISGTSSGACSRTYRDLYTIGGNAAGMPCMFPFQYKDQWYSDCTTHDSSEKRLWCAVETKYQSERWGYCPVTSKDGWNKHPTTGVYYQLNTQSALTWQQADASCKQQGSSLLSITDPHQLAYVTALLGKESTKLWIGLILHPEHGWKWSNGRPYRYLKWDTGHPLPNPGHNCALVEPALQCSWQSSPCSKKLGYICYSEAAEPLPTPAAETGFCSRPWIPYNDHCFYLNRTQKTWTDAQRECHDGGGDLVSIGTVEDQSFIISQLGYTSTDELWIGLNDRKTEGLFDWTDHATVSFTSWEFGAPAVSTGAEDCVLMRGENGNWADRVCEEKHGYICMKKSASKPTGDAMRQDEGCKTGWRRHGSYCYFIGALVKTFDEAIDDCRRSDSYLADVSNGVDNAFLVSLVGMRPEKHFWLGLSNKRNFDEFVWTNRNPVKFTHWNAGMPGPHQGCVAMTTGIFAGLWDVLPCTNKEKYICKHLAEGAGLTTVAPTYGPAQCAPGWTQLRLQPKCFKMFSNQNEYKRTWFEARDYCRAIGGDLLSIHSRTDFPPQHWYGLAWIGLNAPDPATGYVWSDGSPLQYQHWKTGEPNNKNNLETCGQMDVQYANSRGSWTDEYCEIKQGWLCQISIGETPKPPPPPTTPDYNTTSDGWKEWRGNQYYFYKRTLPMESARRFCKQRHGDLVTINSEAENIFLWDQIYKGRSYSSTNYWIGLTIDLDKTYGWMDDSPVVFQRWDVNQPLFLNNDEHCVVMTTAMGFWRDYGCGFEHFSICKRNASTRARATAAPTVVPKGDCPANWKRFDSKCYKVINNQRETWKGAQTQCRSMGGNLASIPSNRVQVFLRSQMLEAPTTDLWIGLHNLKNGPFYWTDGQPMKYTNWGIGTFPYSFNKRDFNRGRSTRQQSECAVLTTYSKSGIGTWIKKSCNDTNGMVCLRNLDSSLPEATESTPTDYVRIGNVSIKIVSQQMTWDAAKKHCESDGAKLANLRNEWTQVYLELVVVMIKSPVWIGLNKNETGGYFRYIDGWRLTFTNWDSSEPRINGDCVYANLNGRWKTSDCNKEMASICLKSHSTDVPPTTDTRHFPGKCPDPNGINAHPFDGHSRYNWIPFRGYCYIFSTETASWSEATIVCLRYGGALASIEDPSEQDFIESNIKVYQDSRASFWIALYQNHKGEWLWLDKSIVDYTNWDKDESSGGRLAGISSRDGKWITGGNWQDRAYICKTPKVLEEVPTTTVKPTVEPQSHGHIILPLVLVIIVLGIVIAIFLIKKSGRRLPIPEKLSTFDNPLFNKGRSQPAVVDSNKLVANAEEEDPQPVITI